MSWRETKTFLAVGGPTEVHCCYITSPINVVAIQPRGFRYPGKGQQLPLPLTHKAGTLNGDESPGTSDSMWGIPLREATPWTEQLMPGQRGTWTWGWSEICLLHCTSIAVAEFEAEGGKMLILYMLLPAGMEGACRHDFSLLRGPKPRAIWVTSMLRDKACTNLTGRI